MRIIQGDCAIEMSQIQANSIDLTVTSPPDDLDCDHKTDILLTLKPSQKVGIE